MDAQRFGDDLGTTIIRPNAFMTVFIKMSRDAWKGSIVFIGHGQRFSQQATTALSSAFTNEMHHRAQGQGPKDSLAWIMFTVPGSSNGELLFPALLAQRWGETAQHFAGFLGYREGVYAWFRSS